jgi:hypothetical protein
MCEVDKHTLAYPAVCLAVRVAALSAGNKRPILGYIASACFLVKSRL